MMVTDLPKSVPKSVREVEIAFLIRHHQVTSIEINISFLLDISDKFLLVRLAVSHVAVKVVNLIQPRYHDTGFACTEV